MTAPRPRLGDALGLLVAGGLALAVALPRYLVGIDIRDEGFLAYGAERVLAGQIPHRDFVSLQPPLSFYSAALVFAVAGRSLAALRVLGVALHLAIVVLVYLVTRQLTGPVPALAAAVPAAAIGLPLFHFVPFAVWHGVAITLGGALCALRAMATGRRAWAWLAGASTTLVLLARHDQGLYLALAVAVGALALGRAGSPEETTPPWTLVSRWAAGLAAGAAGPALYWIVTGAVPDMVRQLVLFPLTTYAKTSSLPMPVLHPGQTLAERLLVGAYYLAPVLTAVGAGTLVARLARRQFGIREAQAAFLVTLAGLFYLQVLTRSDLHHLLITLAPLFVLGGVGVSVAARALGRLPRRGSGRGPAAFAAPAALGLALVTAGGWVWGQVAPAVLPPAPEPARVIALARAGVRAPSPRAATLELLVTTIDRHASADRAILVLPHQPMLYFLAGRRNPTRWNYLWPGDQTADDHRALVRQAQGDPPAVVVIYRPDELAGYAPVLLEYVGAHYRPALAADTWTLYVP